MTFLQTMMMMSPKKSWVLFWTLVLALLFTLASIVSDGRTMSTTSFISSETNPQTKITGPVMVKRKRFPSFEDGGVVVFLHVAKTGGTSIRKNFGNFSHIDLKTLYTMDKWKETSAVADRILTRKVPEDERRILFLEPHGMRALGMPTLHQYLRRWRRFATLHNTSFFAFTLVREPVSYAVSYFNFFNAKPCSLPRCPWKLYAASEEAMLKTNRPDMQCMLLARDHWDIFMNDVFPEKVDKDECDDVYQTLVSEMDWIGTTESMSAETIPLLTRMLAHNRTAAENMGVFNVVKATTSESNLLAPEALSQETVEAIMTLSGNDQAIYDAVRRDYTLDMWENYAEIEA
jgi:hypothetical protein